MLFSYNANRGQRQQQSASFETQMQSDRDPSLTFSRNLGNDDYTMMMVMMMRRC